MKKIIKIIKVSLICGYDKELFYSELINQWIVQDGDEKKIMTRAVKLLRKQNREYMILLLMILQHMEKKNVFR